jgi:[pyruvate, water dikinase]-phosphate phosphotransferase / [pyruvate, water dikinase] kinase
MPDVLHLHLISDSTGETLESVAKASLARFEGAQAVKHFWPMVRSEGHLDRIIEEVAKKPGLVIYTLVDGLVRDRLEMRCATLGLPMVSPLDPTISALSELLGQAATRRPGRQHVMDQAYFRRVDAINYTMVHDDGAQTGLEELEEADILLLGVSRTSKTPTSIYLANRGYKTANIPLVPQSPPASHVWTVKGPLLGWPDHGARPAAIHPPQPAAYPGPDARHRLCRCRADRGRGRLCPPAVC